MTRQKFITEIIKVVDEHIDNPALTGAFIAEKMDTNRMNIHRKLKLYFRKNASEFIKERRLLKARQLLCTRQLMIKEVAREVGFKDITYFSRVFKNHMNLSPSQFKKLHS